MATKVRLVEKEFFLKVLYDEQFPIVYHKNKIEYTFFLINFTKKQLVFISTQNITRLKARTDIELKFDYHGRVIVFSVEILHIKHKEIICTSPEYLYKNLDRSYSRVSVPEDMQVQFSFLGNRYNLSFPKVQQFDSMGLGSFFKNTDLKNLSGLIAQMAASIKKFASDYKMVIFKDVELTTMEERIIAETGKTLFLPSVQAGFPQTDPFPYKRLVTEEIFHNYLAGIGVAPDIFSDTSYDFIKSKMDSGLFSDAWFPILFQEYVIGYVHIWINEEGKRPFDYEVVEVMYQFTKVLAHSLEVNGYFEEGRVQNSRFEGNVIDISASGLLFFCLPSEFSSALLPDSKLTATIITPNRNITVKSIVVRRFEDESQCYFGCRFEELTTDELRYLFEFIYGKPFTSFDAKFLAGQV